MSTDNHQRTVATQTHSCDLGDMISELHLNQYINIVTKIYIFKYPYKLQLWILVCIVKSIPVTTHTWHTHVQLENSNQTAQTWNT